MAGKTSYELHHNFPKLADESGFAFSIHRPRAHVDWNKIRLIDIDSLIRERKFTLIEQHVSDILNCVLESEFDVRILNDGVLKMFRLAQLAVEYQQFCRQYLDRSVYVLKEEISSLIQELEFTKKDLREKDDEIRKLKRKAKPTYRTMPYGNENIAAMILKTLSQKNELFPSTSNGDMYQYNKCSYCDKVFLNQLYLKSHIARRHENAVIPQREIPENMSNEIRLSEEITELKNKLKEMESFINENKRFNQNVITNPSTDNTVQSTATKSDDAKVTTNLIQNNMHKKTKDAEVSTNNEDYLLDKIEEWKKEEHEKYQQEISILRNQILETINSLKDREIKSTNQTEANVIDLLHKTIREQGAEIMALKNELNHSKAKSDNENVQLRKEAEEQLAHWTKQLEAQSKQQDLLLHKLNDVAKKAQETRQQAEREKSRAKYLENILRENIRNKENEDHNDEVITMTEKRIISQKTKQPQGTTSLSKKQSHPKQDATPKYKTVSDRKTLEILHQKAQELLNLETISSSSSDTSSEDRMAEIIKLQVANNHKPVKLPDNSKPNYKQNKIIQEQRNKDHLNEQEQLQDLKSKDSQKYKDKKFKTKKSQAPNKDTNGHIQVQRSPMKVVRAKITEEVNNRIVSAGMDPLKLRLPKNVFHKQRLVLQQQQDQKAKKNPMREKIKHSILAYLDSAVSNTNISIPDTVSPNKESRSLSLRSVLSNVKSKALSLVKSNDIYIKTNQKIPQLETASRDTLNVEVTKRALDLLNTPPGSIHSSPEINKQSPKKENNELRRFSNPLSHDTHKSGVNSEKDKNKKRLKVSKSIVHDDTSSDSMKSNHEYFRTSQQVSKSIDNLIKSPARRPASAEVDYNHGLKKYIKDNDDIVLTRTQSALNVSNITDNNLYDMDDIKSIKEEHNLKRQTSDENMQSNTKQTKSVLKNASSTSSLNKKKVLFDMDAIQMKSVSASPSQSITEKNDDNEKYELGLINLDGEEWDISSIENEPLKNDTKIQVNNRTSPKIAELKQSIESQLARRNETPSTVRIGGVDITGPMVRVASSIGGSNTSLGSSILDDSDGIPVPSTRTLVKPKKNVEKEDSEVDISDFSIDGIRNKNGSF
ncbi:cilium assembly protein DZIP1 [Amyelois transitella]|uniref:cilium assembly protein DZIP1 n=1 Tax=Amyelois transitella TaxID=680683 RepID=UPI00298F970C|nr:cilium assembly protein DZIP1 [Amyelois transitella]